MQTKNTQIGNKTNM